MAKRWYIVHAYTNFERKVAEAILRRGLIEVDELRTLRNKLDVCCFKRQKKFTTTKELPEGLHVYQRVGPDERLWFALNYTKETLSFTPPGTWEDILNGETCAGEIQVTPLDLRILAAAR